MKISVITAVLNRATTISHTIRSVQHQTYSSVEHIVQDGGSTDGTQEITARLANSSTKLESRPDSGIYDAINRGILRSTGDIVGLMHSDDFFAHDRVLEKVATAFRDSSVSGVYGDLEYVAATQTSHVVRLWKSGAYARRKLGLGWMPPHPTLYLKREVYDAWGLFDTSFQIAADYDAMMRYLVNGRINLAYLPEVMVKMRVGGESNRSVGRIIKKSIEDLRAIRRNQIGGVGTLAMKNASKLGQFFARAKTSNG